MNGFSGSLAQRLAQSLSPTIVGMGATGARSAARMPQEVAHLGRAMWPPIHSQDEAPGAVQRRPGPHAVLSADAGRVEVSRRLRRPARRRPVGPRPRCANLRRTLASGRAPRHAPDGDGLGAATPTQQPRLVLGDDEGCFRRGPGRGATARRCLGAPRGQPCVDRTSDSSRHREPEGGRDGLAGGVDVLRGKGHYGHRSRKTTWWSPPSSLCCGGSESASPSPTRCSHHELRDRAVLASPGRVEVSSLPLAVSADARAERTTSTQDGR